MKFHKVNVLPEEFNPNDIFFVKNSQNTFDMYVVNNNGLQILNLNTNPLTKIKVLETNPVNPIVGDQWITEYNTVDGEVIGLGLLFTYNEPTTIEAFHNIKGTNQILTIKI